VTGPRDSVFTVFSSQMFVDRRFLGCTILTFSASYCFEAVFLAYLLWPPERLSSLLARMARSLDSIGSRSSSSIERLPASVTQSPAGP